MPVYKDKERNTYYYEGSYVDTFGIRKRYKKRGFEGKRIAQKAEKEFLLHATTNAHSNINFEELAGIYLEYKKRRVKDRSLAEYKTRIKNHMLPTFAKLKIDKINVGMIEKWQEQLYDTDMSNTYLETIQQNFNAILSFAVKRRYIDVNPFDMTDYIKRQEIKKEMRFWTLEQFKSYIPYVANDTDYIFTNALYYTGCRIGELLARRWEDIDFNARTMYIYSTYNEKHNTVSLTTKNGETRTIDIPKKLFRLLQEWRLKEQEYDGFNDGWYIFINPLTPSYPRALAWRKDKYIKTHNAKNPENQIPRIRIHDFRHSHVSLLANEGFDSWEIALRLGHTKEMVDRTYAHMFPERKKKLKDYLDSL